ncbi:MAG: PQQ-binding-like beta-propeller repeat protein, partial [Fidelibacterota bacterium]
MKNRKSITSMIMIGILIICAVSVSAQDWPQWRGANRDSKVTGFKVPQTWQQELNQSWKVDVGFADATPALVNNRLYVFTRQGEKEVLRCLNSATGEQIWQTEGYVAATVTGPARSHPGPRSTPAVADGKVVTVGVGGVVSCHNAASGKLIWRSEDFTDAYPRYFMGMSPLIVDGLCVAHLGGTGSGQFVAFELATGNIKWKTAGSGPGYGSPVMITVDGTKQCVFQAERKLVGLDLSDGALLWEVSTPMEGRSFYAASPVADQQKVYYTGANNGV